MSKMSDPMLDPVAAYLGVSRTDARALLDRSRALLIAGEPFNEVSIRLNGPARVPSCGECGKPGRECTTPIGTCNCGRVIRTHDRHQRLMGGAVRCGRCIATETPLPVEPPKPVRPPSTIAVPLGEHEWVGEGKHTLRCLACECEFPYVGGRPAKRCAACR